MLATDPKVDDYIARSPQFAKPILARLRQIVHEGSPEVKEALRSGRPTFFYKGKTLAVMTAFATHCAFSFWVPSVSQKLAESAVAAADSPSRLGRLTNPSDLPSDDVFRAYVREAREAINSRRGSLKRLIREPMWRAILFVLGGFLTLVFFPTVMANLDYNRKLNDKRLSLAHDAIEHDEQVNALVGEMTSQLNLFWVDTHDLKVTKLTPKVVAQADTEFRKRWESFNNIAWFRYWNLLSDAYATQAIRRSENDFLRSVVNAWIESTSTTNMHLGDLKVATIYKPDEKRRTALIKQMEDDRRNRDKLAYQIYTVLVSNTQPGVWKDLRGLFGKRD